MLRHTYLFLLLACFGLSAEPSKQELNAINNYVEYLNKSVHGLFVVHKLLEIDNQELNKYVDLDSHNMYNISNSDVSTNVFTENSFYEKQLSKSQRNPFELADIARDHSNVLPTALASKWNDKTYTIKDLLSKTNQVRYDMESYLQSHDLNVRAEIYGAYEILERAKNLFFSFYTMQLDFYRELEKYNNEKFESGNYTDLLIAMKNIHESSRLILDALRFRNDNSFEDLNNNLVLAYAEYQSVVKKYSSNPQYSSKGIKSNLLKIDQKVGEVISACKEFRGSATVPQKYKQYGKYYHYHNNEIVADLNWFGSGFINEMNDVIDKLGIQNIKFIDIPLFFQVIYPMKLDSIGHISSTDPEIDKIPSELLNRRIQESRYQIHADSQVVVLKLFDHLIQDGDVVSINFNGDWILEKHSIEKKPTELILKLNPIGKNYLLLHAVNEGRRPPNTMGIRYNYMGETKEIELRSDLDTSELIEIIRPKTESKE